MLSFHKEMNKVIVFTVAEQCILEYLVLLFKNALLITFLCR